MQGPIEAHPLKTFAGTVQTVAKEPKLPATSFPVEIPTNFPL